MDDNLRACWDELVELVLAEYRANNETVFLNFYHNFDERTLDLRVTGPNARWERRTVSDDELRSGDVPAIAAAIYAETRSR